MLRHSKLRVNDENPFDDEYSNIAILLDILIGAFKLETHTTIEIVLVNSRGHMPFQPPLRSRTYKSTNKL